MMQRAAKNIRLVNQARMFSYNYANAAHPRVWLDVNRDGQPAGRFVFELYASHSPALVENFTAFITGQSAGQRSFVGSSFSSGTSGLGVVGGKINSCNLGANDQRVADENLEMRHHKRGIVTMVNDGPNTNGSRFLITFGEAHFLNGYHNVVGEVVEGEDLLSQLESATDRSGKIAGSWTVSNCGLKY